MAILFQDTFTEAANTDLIAHTPDIGTNWNYSPAIGGSNAFRVIGADDELRFNGSVDSSCYAYDDTTNQGGYVSFIPNVGTGIQDKFLALRLVDVDNFYGVEIRGGSLAAFVEVIGGVETDLYTFTPTVGATYTLEDDGTQIELKANGTSEHIEATTTFATETKKGFVNRSASNTPNVTTFYESGTLSTPTGITFDEANYNNIVYQRNSSNQYTINRNVTYTGSPTALQYRILDGRDDVTEIVGWTTFDASPSGGTSVLNIVRPASIIPNKLQVRFSDASEVSSIEANQWFIGDIVLIIGQSLAERFSTDYAITAVDGYVEFNGSSGLVPTLGAGANEIGRIITESDDAAVMVINSASGGTALTFEAVSSTNNWANLTSALFLNTITDVQTATVNDNRLAFVWWHQGTRDSQEGVSEQLYRRMNDTGGLTSLFKNLRDNFTDEDGNTLNIFCASLGRDTRGTGSVDTSHQGIRNAQLFHVNADPFIYHVPAFWTELTDGVHATQAGAIKMAGQIMAARAFQKGDITQDIPRLVSVDIDGGRTNLTLTFSEDLNTSDTNYSIEGLRVEDNGSPVTINSHTRVGTRTTQIALNSAISAGAEVRIYLMYGVGTTNNDLSYPRTVDVTLPGTAGSVSVICEAANALLEEI